ncbi:MAG TPA: hypothetical protein DCR55_03925 [Lentisphaeria bacterium]|nr:hypothetical protein [Lentisphaeria bacterium]
MTLPAIEPADSLRESPRWEHHAIFCAFGAILLSTGILEFTDLANQPPVVIIVAGTFAIHAVGSLVILAFAKVRSLQPLRQTLDVVRKPELRPLLWAVPAMLLANIVLSALSTALLELLHIPIAEPVYVDWIRNGSTLDLAALFAAAVLVAPFTEELMFRHTLYRACNHFIGTTPSLVITALIFAAFHWFLAGFLSLFVIALILQRVRNQHGLSSSILAHMTYNQIMLCLAVIVERSGAL